MASLKLPQRLQIRWIPRYRVWCWIVVVTQMTATVTASLMLALGSSMMMLRHEAPSFVGIWSLAYLGAWRVSAALTAPLSSDW